MDRVNVLRGLLQYHIEDLDAAITAGDIEAATLAAKRISYDVADISQALQAAEEQNHDQ